MDARALKRWTPPALTLLGSIAGAWALLLLAHSTENSADFNRRQPWIILLNICAVLALGVLLARKLWQLYEDFRDHVPGSRLTARTVGMFGTLVVVPLLIVYLFALEFLNYGIDSWFRVEIKQGLNDALVLSRSALELRVHEQSRRTGNFADAIAAYSGTDLAVRLDAERRATQAADITVYDSGGRVLNFSSANAGAALPPPAPFEARLQIAAGHSYFMLQPPSAGGRATIVTAAPLPRVAKVTPGRFVIINYEVPAQLSGLADAVQAAYSNYGDMSATREPLKINFILTLTLVLLITMLAAVYGAIWSAQRLTRPVKDLIAGTRAVGKGDFAMRLPLPSRDEMGFLVHSFNDMTKRLRRTSEEAALSREAVERERERLAVILSRLSSGVLVIDTQLTLRSANQSAGMILRGDLAGMVGQKLVAASGGGPLLAEFAAALRDRLAEGDLEWREQLELNDEAGTRILLWACTALPHTSEDPGLVIVFEDVTALLIAQRNAAWGEVARRLAHEIKNPLTPIQLSAEQLRRKLLPGLDTERARLLERATHTIVQQVDAMKQMVNAFSEYARSPEVQLANFSLNQLTAEVVELYRLQDPGVAIVMELDPQLPEIEADRGRVRQVLANLLSNGIEALAGVTGAAITVRTRWLHTIEPAQAEITVSDNGPGFREDILRRAFDPYVTSKARGTGLGLAIVQRIVEEHGGRISAENPAAGGARIRVLLPTTADKRAELREGTGMNASRILVVDDEADIRRLLQEILSEEGHDVDVAADAAQARAARARSAPDLVLLDIWMPDTDGITLLREWSGDARHDCPVVMMSGHGTVETAVEATRLGAFDFIEKPLSLAKLLPTVKRALDARRTRQAGGHMAARAQAPLHGRSRVALQLRSELLRLAAYPAPLLLIAEPGSETEALARFVHASSPRGTGPFVSCNPRALQDEQAAAALLGSNGQTGLLEQAAGGTLFLGDIEELPDSARRLLAGVLEGGSYARDGDGASAKFDARVIGTALPGIETRAGGSGMSRDLYAQLAVLPLRVPPLREYAEDVPDLLRQCVDQLTEGEQLQFRRCSVAAQNRLRNYPWPDNLREMRNLLRRLLLRGGPEEITLEEVERELAAQAPIDAPLVKQDLLSLPMREAREHFERAYLQQQLQLCGGKVGQLAKRVGMERTHLYRKLRSLGIEISHNGED